MNEEIRLSWPTPPHGGPPVLGDKQPESTRTLARYDVVVYYEATRAQWRTGIFWADTGLSLHVNDMETALDVLLAEEDVRTETDRERYARTEHGQLAQHLEQPSR
jgi:hypothetical protein